MPTEKTIDRLFQEVKDNTMKTLLEKSSSRPSQDLSKLYFNFMEVKEILYECLMNIEIDEIKRKWDRSGRL